MARVSTNVPREPLRWSALRAAEEFALDAATLRKRLVASEQKPDKDGCYSTAQILSAVFNDSKALKDREVKERGDKLSLQNKVLRSELLDRKQIESGLIAAATAITQIIKGSNLSARDKTDILNNLEKSREVIDNVAKIQNSQIRVITEDE